MGIKNPGFRSFLDWDPGFLSACRFLYPPGHSFSRYSKGDGFRFFIISLHIVCKYSTKIDFAYKNRSPVLHILLTAGASYC